MAVHGVATDRVVGKVCHADTEFTVASNCVPLDDVMFCTCYPDTVTLIAQDDCASSVRTDIVASDEVILNA
jgi:hypothetical protein